VRKQHWIRLVGLLSLFGWGLAAMLFWAGTNAPDLGTKSNVSILTFMSLGGAGFLTFLWTVLTLVERLERPAAAKVKAG
jgi:hypothetical protein